MIWCMFLAAVEGTLSKEEWNQSRWDAVVRFQVKDDGDHNGESWEVVRSAGPGVCFGGRAVKFADVGE